MSKSIYTLVPDIYEMVGGSHGISAYASDMAFDIARSLEGALGPREHRGLRLSGLGPKCPRHLWYEVNHPELAEPLPPHARIKYLYGHIIEHMMIGLAKAAGHEVTGEQDELVVDGIVGHRDAVVDGCVVDFKSAASRSFLKFRDGTIAKDDPFGYLDQIDGYVLGSLDDPLVRVKDKGFLVAVDKQLGHVVLYGHEARVGRIRDRIKTCKEIVRLPYAPACECETEPEGKSGNIRLSVKSSYSPYKHSCFPGLRTFLYASGPVHLCKVVRVPDVTEVDKYGKIVYH